jgi:hypothetical protein
MEAHDYQIGAEPDVSGKVNRHIWYYFISLGFLLVLTIIGLTIMYRFQVDYEVQKKVGVVISKEVIEQKAASESYLSGKRGLFEGKKHISINDAMARFLQDARKVE